MTLHIQIINNDQCTCGPLDAVETCFRSISNMREFNVRFQCPWDFFLNTLLVIHSNTVSITNWHATSIGDVIFITRCRCWEDNGDALLENSLVTHIPSKHYTNRNKLFVKNSLVSPRTMIHASNRDLKKQ